MAKLDMEKIRASMLSQLVFGESGEAGYAALR
jgi:hypothetical protein